MPSSIRNLPPLILEEICDQLALVQDEDEEHSLRAFSLASRMCYHASAKVRFRTIRLSGALSDFQTCDEILAAGSHFRHVRELIVDRSKNGFVGPPGPHLDERVQWGILDMDDHLKPTSDTLQRYEFLEAPQESDPDRWQALAQLIGRMNGLKDFVFALPNRLDPCILGAVHAVSCRLHMHSFNLASLHCPPEGPPGEIDPDDYAIVTSPCLYSIVVSCNLYDAQGRANYHREALMRMVAGKTPNLAHVWLRTSPLPDTPLLRRIRLSERNGARKRPVWQRFFPSSGNKEGKAVSTGSLRSLMLENYYFQALTSFDSVSWSHDTDFSSLRCLDLRFSCFTENIYNLYRESLYEFANMAADGRLASLQSFGLGYVCGKEQYSNELASIVTTFLHTIHPLRTLHLPHGKIRRVESLF